MKSLEIKNILIPTDFSKTGLLAVEHAAFMTRLCKANLYLLHAIEFSENIFSIYDPAIIMPDFTEVEKIANSQLNDLAEKLKKKYAITVKTICTRGKVVPEIVTAVNENKIDLVVMGTHGASGFNEYFVGSNAQRIVAICPCPVITIQAHTKKIGFTDILIPIDNHLHSREKVANTIALAKQFAAKIHILGLLDKKKDTDLKKFKIKLESIEKAVKKAELIYDVKIVTDENLAKAALKHSKKIKADLISVLTDESRIDGIFSGKRIVNHSRIPVLSMKPDESFYESTSLAGATSPF